MGLSGRLCNSTPWAVEIPWHRTKINVPGDAHVELYPEQLEDFRPGKPGSEEVRRMLQYFGCFLYDTDRSYDVQLFEALQAAVKEKKQQYTDFLTNLRNDRIKAGQNNVTDGDLESAIQMQGYGLIRDQISTMEARVLKLRTALGTELTRTRQAPKYDPERTCFGTSPPREFATKLALELFLESNPEAAEKHGNFVEKMQAAANG